MKNPQELIGKKVRGFKFNKLWYLQKMDNYIGKIGAIKQYDKNEDWFLVKFNNDSCAYPADQIEAHLVENEIPTFTKEDLRVAYKAGFNLVKPNKECDGHFERWYQKTYELTKEEQLTAILGSSDKVSEIMELFKK